MKDAADEYEDYLVMKLALTTTSEMLTEAQAKNAELEAGLKDALYMLGVYDLDGSLLEAPEGMSPGTLRAYQALSGKEEDDE